MTGQDRPHDYLTEAEDTILRYPYGTQFVTDEAFLLRGCLAALTSIALLTYEAAPPLEEPQKAAPVEAQCAHPGCTNLPGPGWSKCLHHGHCDCMTINSAGTGPDHSCRDCPEQGGIGFDCHHLVRGRRLADSCGWCRQRAYIPGQVIPRQ